MSHMHREFHGKAYRIVDIWNAIFITMKCWIILAAGVGVVGSAIILLLAGDSLPKYFFAAFFFISFVIAVPFGLRVWKAQSEGIYIDPATASLSFSADDVENSITEIISLQRFFDHARRVIVSISDIERIDNENYRVNRKGTFRYQTFPLNIAGDFGSYQLIFMHKQKRDECRALLVRVMKKVKGSAPARDFNIAFPS